MSDWIQIIILSIIEGLTEFLPVSSTGHMILASSVMGIASNEFIKLFEIVVQLAAIVAVVVFYKKKFFPLNKWNFYIKLIVAVVPALILGAIFSHKIHALLSMPIVTAVTLFIGGFILLFIDNVFKNPTIHDVDQVSYKKGFIIGIWQCLAMIPGMSRSASSIIGGMQQKLDRSTAAEFSFFLAVPTMCAATGKDLLDSDSLELLKNSHNLTLLIVGCIVAFIVALLSIKYFIEYLKKFGFKAFGWYRIIIGGIFMILCLKGIVKGESEEAPKEQPTTAFVQHK